MLALLFRTRLKLACLNATLERQDHRQVAQLLSSFLDLRDKIVRFCHDCDFPIYRFVNWRILSKAAKINHQQGD